MKYYYNDAMKEYSRTYPKFSLCGLNCALCPRHYGSGTSVCPGCGGADFHEKHPSCPVITCSRKNGNVEFCFQCSRFPCQRYQHIGESDSFITYRKVLEDLMEAKELGIEVYMKKLTRREAVLSYLLETCNDGRKKSFFCLAANLLPIDELEEIVLSLKNPDIRELKQRSELSARLLQSAAEKHQVILKLNT